MDAEIIDHTTLTRLAEADLVKSACATGQAGGWGIKIRYGVTEKVLAAQRSGNVRVFRKLETLVEYLRKIGITYFEIDSVNYDAAGSLTGKRPDRALALKDAHQAAAYDKWLKQEIQVALDETGPPIPHEEVMRDVREVIKRARAKRA